MKPNPLFAVLLAGILGWSGVFPFHPAQPVQAGSSNAVTHFNLSAGSLVAPGLLEYKITPFDDNVVDALTGQIGVSGDRVVFGDDRRFRGTPDPEPGLIYTLRRTSTGWVEEPPLIDPNNNWQDYFGWSLAIDGDTLVVGAYTKDTHGLGDSGGAYVFQHGSSGWELQATLAPADIQEGDRFGFAVAIHGDTIAVSSTGKYPYRGAVYLFTRDGADWTEAAKLALPGLYPWNFLSFGTRLSLDDTHLLTDASDCDYPTSCDGSSAFLFTKPDSGWVSTTAYTRWIQPAAKTTMGLVQQDRILLIVNQKGVNDTIPAKSIPYYQYDGETWQNAGVYTPEGLGEDSTLSQIITDGQSEYVGITSSQHSGAVYQFKWDGAQYVTQKIFSASDANGSKDGFGWSIAQDGSILAVDAHNVSYPSGGYAYPDSGAIYLYVPVMTSTYLPLTIR